ncbi:MAG: hypothetical protein IJI73_05660, partial [Kiritimatiellae bacterium]|nr:hypothetical protein [Kiritimatiellia bacterium]
GQLASASCGTETETFLWDGLALIQRGDEQFVNEPHVGGGNPVASSKGTSYFNDMLGTTVGAKKDGKYSAAALTAFGENLSVHSPTPTQNSNFFTGKPFVEGLGHAFLMRNYRASLSKWQTADPMGYPDGWNQLAYCGNGVARKVDIVGCWGANVHHDINQTYLENQEIDRHAYKWGKFSLDVLGKMNSGSDWTDSIWAGNQNDDKAYMHAMCSAWEGTAGARLRWETYLNELVVKARALSDLARQMYSTGDYEIALYTENLAIEYLGRIFHTYDDSFAPPHSGFQRFSDQNLFDHIAQESWDVYVTGEYRVELPHINPIPGNEAVTIITYRTGGFRNYIYQQIRDAYMQTVLYVLRQPE